MTAPQTSDPPRDESGTQPRHIPQEPAPASTHANTDANEPRHAVVSVTIWLHMEAMSSKIILMMPKNQELRKFQRIKIQVSRIKISRIKFQESRFKNNQDQDSRLKIQECTTEIKNLLHNFSENLLHILFSMNLY